MFHSVGTPPEYQRVVVRGVYDYAHTHYIGPRPRSVVGGSQVGYVVITPLVDPDSGRAVLVNRGWVPAAWRNAEGAEEAASMGRGGASGGLGGWLGRSNAVQVVSCLRTLGMCNHPIIP